MVVSNVHCFFYCLFSLDAHALVVSEKSFHAYIRLTTVEYFKCTLDTVAIIVGSLVDIVIILIFQKHAKLGLGQF
jgi:hypothetical protein